MSTDLFFNILTNEAKEVKRTNGLLSICMKI